MENNKGERKVLILPGNVVGPSKETSLKYVVVERLPEVPANQQIKNMEIKRKPQIATTTSTTATSSNQACLISRPSALTLHLGDEESLKRRFGWFTLEQHYVPYLMRNGIKYCAVRMMEKFLAPYLAAINPDIYRSCTSISTLHMTETEMSVLNEVNTFHCDYQFGRNKFSNGDLLIPLHDATEFYKFLVTCTSKLLRQESTKCGFLLIDGRDLVPFVVHNLKKWVPLFYFEDDHCGKLSTVTSLKGWPLSYLKFCFKVQKIRSEYCNISECTCASFEELRVMLGPVSISEDAWPTFATKTDEFICKTSDIVHVIPTPWYNYSS